MISPLLRLLLVLGFLFGSGGWLVAVGWNAVQTNKLLDEASATVEGRVIEGSTRPLDEKGQSSTLLIEYTPPNRPPITREFDVDHEAYRTALDAGRIAVTYSPAQPEVSRVTRFADGPFYVLTVLGALMLLAGVVCLFVGWKR